MNRPLPHDPEVDEQLVAYLDGELDAEEAAAVENRLAADPQFRARLQELDRTWNVLDELPRGEPTASFTQSTLELVVADIRREQARSQRNIRRLAIQFAALIAVPLLFAFGAYAMTQHVRNQPYREFLNDLDLIENFEVYEKVGADIEFLEMLEQNGLFVGDGNNGQ